MSRFFNLILNEQIKTYLRRSTWAMYIIIIGLIVGLAILTKTFDVDDVAYTEDNWRDILEQDNEVLMKEIEEDEFLEGVNTMFIEENNFYLDNDIQPHNYGAWKFVYENNMLLMLVSLFTIVIAAGIIAHEFRWGTIKLLLIRPISRSTILLSKYISVLLFALMTLLFVFITAWITGALFFGVEGASPHILIYTETMDLKYVAAIEEILSDYGYQMINLVMMATFAFMISAVFRNSTLAIGIAIFLMMAGNSIVTFFADRSWAKYILFANTNLKQYSIGSPMIEGMTLSFSITVLLIYYILFISVTWIFFTKRDVAGT
ncbi:MAG TPA: ABC transporter permease subunit [Virgibacillus sp.]|nr:ABC transporter permease subunit [Virgibacillus sp.]